MDDQYAIVCLGPISRHINGAPILSCHAYGPFAQEDLAEAEQMIRRIEGDAIFTRPLISLKETIARMSAD